MYNEKDNKKGNFSFSENEAFLEKKHSSGTLNKKRLESKIIEYILLPL